MTRRNQPPRHLRRHPLVAAADAPLADHERDPHRRPRSPRPPRAALGLALTVPLAAAACAHRGEPDGPAASPASGPASAPASAPARLDVALTHSASVSADALRAHVVELASPRMEGRGPTTTGLERAAAYLEAQLKAIGLDPAFGDAYRQTFEMKVAIRRGPQTRLAVGKQAFEAGADLWPYTFTSEGSVTAPVVFAGYGIRSKDHDYDDYAGLDVKGKIVVVLAGEPGDDDPKSPFDGTRRTSHSAARTKLVLAREAGAAALLIVHADIDTAAPDHVVEDAGLLTARVSPGAARDLVGFDVADARAAIDAAYAPAPMPGQARQATLRIDLDRQGRDVANVAGLLGPADAKEWVVIGAHYDHLGFGGPDSLAPGQRAIHHGADDNASGTAVVLEVARALAAEQANLRRRVLFVLFAGEERGLLGSADLVKRFPIPIERVAAMVNLDMVGRLREGRLNVMGLSTAPEWPALVREVVAARGLEGRFGGDGYGPSDHTSFYAAGVPVLFLFTGAHADYHKPSDTADKLEYPGMAKVAGVAADLVSALARAEGRPTLVRAPAPAAHGSRGGGRGYGPYFGSIPDFGGDVKGVRFSGVRPGSPADEAGVQKGDVLIEFAGISVQNLQDFTVALRRSAPGDVVVVKVRRGAEVLEMKAKLTRRGE